jgi:phosphatidylinositol 3-kinase
LLLWRDQEADGSVDTRTPSKMGVKDEMGRLEKVCPYEFIAGMKANTNLTKLVKKYERGDMPKSDWLDKLVFRRMEEIHAVCRCLFSVK